jgi:serine/threonine-protein kinase
MKTCPQCSKTYGDHLQVCPDDQSPLVIAGLGTGDPMIGRLLDGRYRLEKKIGEGGMGAIYKAVHTGMGRTCAIKLLTLLSPGNDDAVARFKREAKMASRIDNPHAVTIYDFGQSEDGTLFLAMELIDGVALSRLVAQERVLPATRAIHIASQIAEGLAAAHALEIIHRDLKPDNIMLTRKGAALDYVKVLDFGIAKTVADDSADNLTKTGFVLGTPVYMSPEQLLGEKLDPRSDIYSLAIIVYEMLSGRLPFEGENQQSIMMKRITSEPVRITRFAPSISEALERAVMGGLARDPAVRTRTVEAFAASLRTALQSGTQFFGGRATVGLTDQAGPATKEYSGFETSADPPAAMAGLPVTRVAAGDSPAVFGQHSASGVPPHTADQIAALGAQPTELSIRQPHAVSPAAASAASAAIASEPRRRSPLLLGGGALVLIAIALVVYLFLPFGGSGFTLTVRGAPAGSEVFVNNVSRGQTAADGTLKVAGLAADAMTVRVSHDGFADFNANVDGRKGKEQPLEALLLPVEIDYKGKMALIPAGEFKMGSDRPGPNEQSARRVTLPDYYIDKYEVTNAQYKQFCDATGHSYPKTSFIYGEFARKAVPDEEYFLKHPDSPVIGVTYEDAIAYANWINKRIPGEDEWEKAASWDPNTGKKRLWPWGNETAGIKANIDRKDTAILAPGGQFDGDKSAYGVFDLGGSVSEYVSIKSDSSGNENPSASLGEKYIVVRGGSLRGDFESAKTTKRGVISLEAKKKIDGDPIFGFRCAMYANDPKIQEVLRARK